MKRAANIMDMFAWGQTKGWAKFFEAECKRLCLHWYMGTGHIRDSLYSRLKNIGFSLPVISDPSAVISEHSVIGEGTFVGKNAVVNADARIGKMTIINTASVVEHEVSVGDFSHIAVGLFYAAECKWGTIVWSELMPQ